MPFNEYHEIKLFMEQSFPSNNAADVISVFLCCCSSIFEVASFLSFERKRNLKKNKKLGLQDTGIAVGLMRVVYLKTCLP